MEEGPFHFWSEQSVISHNLKMISDLLTEYHRTWFKGEDVDLDASSECISIRFLYFVEFKNWNCLWKLYQNKLRIK
jgi:hypothetical protein